MSVRHAEIVGAGLAGLTAAAALCARGWTVRVHERAAEMRAVGSGLSIFENGLRVLKAIGAEEDAIRQARRGLERETRDAQGRTTSNVRYATRMYEVTREQVLAALANAAERAGAEIVTSSEVVSVDKRGAITLATGATIKADLVIAADGVHSRMRDRLGVPCHRKWLADGAIRIMIPRTPAEVASPDGAKNIEYWSGHRRVLVAACSETELYVALTTLDRDYAAKSIPIDKGLWKASFPCLEGLIDRLDGDARWDRFQVVKLPHWSRGRVAILGDAAHAMAPNLGQGGACAMMNALGLAVALDEESNVPDALNLWERRERPLTDHTQRLSTFYSALTTWPGLARSAAFALIARSSWLRAQYLRTALCTPTGTVEPVGLKSRQPG
ncbi:NAD(P)/FAD-dependent oxidoreductase [Bradyrhizobium sp. NP1]|uniref:FAD-dependent oxidoreductase n=1 Tax=Bradyrhizobium sp. NP1 TaxID=3049772 RepID=UPI0025A55D51|nr:NAD(P)/FAD-dependent oxidoreductase [Bradyrhizobium sp. NP1]WJR79216.1 NAD(P)/FAD-dependent oxidoreductase [Bradyrhizobium sp. NP1]